MRSSLRNWASAAAVNSDMRYWPPEGTLPRRGEHGAVRPVLPKVAQSHGSLVEAESPSSAPRPPSPAVMGLLCWKL
jgi:hypothetical protein